MEKYGKLTLVERNRASNGRLESKCLWQCECGSMKRIRYDAVKSRHTVTCGGCAINTSRDIDEMTNLLRDGVPPFDIATMYGCSTETVRKKMSRIVAKIVRFYGLQQRGEIFKIATRLQKEFNLQRVPAIDRAVLEYRAEVDERLRVEADSQKPVMCYKGLAGEILDALKKSGSCLQSAIVSGALRKSRTRSDVVSAIDALVAEKKVIRGANDYVRLA